MLRDVKSKLGDTTENIFQLHLKDSLKKDTKAFDKICRLETSGAKKF